MRQYAFSNCHNILPPTVHHLLPQRLSQIWVAVNPVVHHNFKCSHDTTPIYECYSIFLLHRIFTSHQDNNNDNNTFIVFSLSHISKLDSFICALHKIQSTVPFIVIYSLHVQLIHVVNRWILSANLNDVKLSELWLDSVFHKVGAILHKDLWPMTSFVRWPSRTSLFSKWSSLFHLNHVGQIPYQNVNIVK